MLLFAYLFKGSGVWDLQDDLFYRSPRRLSQGQVESRSSWAKVISILIVDLFWKINWWTIFMNKKQEQEWESNRYKNIPD